ncbi:MAG TPA: hypothetical protein VND65_13200 [Candidatus Binatia bacterium]|nr:hypothetical protein [Candidatus Binatia bacterium]
MAMVGISLSTFSISLQAQGKQQHYYVFNLGDPGGGNVAAAASLNNSGWIAGDSFESGNTSEHAFVWVGTPIDLGTLGGANSTIGWPNKNNHGQLAGIAETADMNPLNEQWSCAGASFAFVTGHICLGFIWQDGVMTALSPLAGGIDSYAAGINNNGQVVGWAENGIHDPTCNDTPPANQVLQFEAVVWGPKLGEITQLSPLSPDPDSAATAINDKGQIVGISGLCDNAVGATSAEHAVLWENQFATPINLGNFDGGLAWNTPTALNNRSQVVGFGNQKGSSASEFNPIAFYWDQQHGIRSINPLDGDTNNLAWGINSQGLIVGQSYNANTGAARAFIFAGGQATDMNTLIQPNSSLQLQLANDANDAGEIVGFAVDTNTNTTVAFLAVPVSENGAPASYAGNNSSRGSARAVSPGAGSFNRFALKGKTAN